MQTHTVLKRPLTNQVKSSVRVSYGCATFRKTITNHLLAQQGHRDGGTSLSAPTTFQEENSNLHLQAELFLPDWVQVAVDRLCSLLGFTHLDGHIRIAGTCPVLGLETLGTDD